MMLILGPTCALLMATCPADNTFNAASQLKSVLRGDTAPIGQKKKEEAHPSSLINNQIPTVMPGTAL